MLIRSRADWAYFCEKWLAFNPHAKQREMADPTLRLVVMACGSGVGKTYGTAAFLLWEAWRNPRHDYAAIAPTNRQAKFVLDDIRTLITNGGQRFLIWVKRWPTQDDPYLELVNGSRIWFLNTAYGADHLKGIEFNGAVHDEAAIDKESSHEIVRTRVRKSPGWLRILSTPKGRNWFFQLAMRVKQEQEWSEGKGEPSTRRFITASSWDNPYYPREILEDRKRTTVDRVYRQEYLGEFVDVEGATFRQEDLDRVFRRDYDPPTEPEHGGLYVHGWDLGRKVSWTVQTTLAFHGIEGKERLRGCEQRAWHGERWPTIYREIEDTEHRWEKLVDTVTYELPGVHFSQPKTYTTGGARSFTILDSTGVGDAAYQNVKINATPFIFTAKSRSEMILRIQEAVEQPGGMVLPATWSRLYTEMQLHTGKEDAEGQTWDHLDSLGLAIVGSTLGLVAPGKNPF